MLNKIKKPAIYLIWNLYMWGIILVEGKIVNYAQSQIKRTGQMEWSYLGMLAQVGVWILVGLGITWLVSKKSISSTRDILLEICTILIPNALLVLLTFPFGVLIPMQRLLIVSMGNLRYVGGLIIGVEIVKFIKYIKNRKEG
ncbi:MAG: hypothetical protein ACLRY5_11055 [Zhenhengia sp.]